MGANQHPCVVTESMGTDGPVALWWDCAPGARREACNGGHALPTAAPGLTRVTGGLLAQTAHRLICSPTRA